MNQLVLFLVVLGASFILYVINRVYLSKRNKQSKRAAVIVLGDIGRSPRMQYHSLSLAKHGYIVDFIGFPGTQPFPQILKHPHQIIIHYIRSFPALPRWTPLRKIFFPLYAAVKLCFQCLQFFKLLYYDIPKPQKMLIQNPPSLPIVPVAWLVARLRGFQIIIDWHNLGYTLMISSLGYSAANPLILLARWLEFFFGKKADFHLCVTHALKEFLHTRLFIPRPTIAVVHDKPFSHFKPVSNLKQRVKFLNILSKDAPPDIQAILNEKIANPNSQKVLLAVSSTSWTPDEDFMILLQTMAFLENLYRSEKNSTFPRILFIVTGKGPQRDQYLSMINLLRMQYHKFYSIWLEAQHYPLLLGCADFGISLHQSSSKLDLPMKILDMYGSGLPVLARDYKCLQDELVKVGKTGYVFNTSHELVDILLEKRGSLGKMRKAINQLYQHNKWDDEWNMNCFPLFEN